MRNWMIAAGILILLSLPIPQQSRSIINVGSKKFTESVIIGEMLRILGEECEVNITHYRELGGTTLVFEALRAGEIDAYPEYTGTIREEILRLGAEDNDQRMEDLLLANGVKMSRSLGFNNTYAIGMLRERARKLGIDQLSDLATHPSLNLGLSNEFLERADGWPGLKKHYQLASQNVTGLDQDIAYQQLLAGNIDCMDVYTTDAKLQQFDIIVLEDDLGFFPRYDAVFLYRSELDKTQPSIVESWRRLENAITPDEMVKANAAVELKGVPEAQVAAGFFESSFAVTRSVESPGLVQRLANTTWQHLQLVRRSLLPAIVFAVPLGILAFRFSTFGKVILVIVSVVQTVPALALLVMLIPLMAFLGFRSVGTGSTAAIVALFLYSLLPIVRNVHSGLRSISREHLEAAKSLGLTETQQLFSVQLPLAWTSIVAGIKTAAVLNIGFATLGALIGAGGFGQPILSGIRLNNTQLILEGAIPAALFAVSVQYLFDAIEYLTTPKGLRASATSQ